MIGFVATKAATSRAALTHKMLRKNRSMGAERDKRSFVPPRPYLGEMEPVGRLPPCKAALKTKTGRLSGSRRRLRAIQCEKAVSLTIVVD
jgi:hypothetical protein